MKRVVAVVCMLLFAATTAHGTAAPPPGPMETYRAAGQTLLQQHIVPALARAAPSVGAPAGLAVVVTPSRDPLDVAVETDRSGSRRLTVSAGFLVFLDSLVEAEVSARLLQREDELPAYRDEIVRYAGVATRTRPDLPNPGRFYRRLGLTTSAFDAVAASPAYQRSRSNNMVQSLAWIAAHRLAVSAIAARASASSRSDLLAARWAWAAGFAPFPLPGAAMLHFAALDPRVADAARLRCRALGALMTSLEQTRAAAAIPGRLPRPVSAAQLDRWAEMIAGTARDEECGR